MCSEVYIASMVTRVEETLTLETLSDLVLQLYMIHEYTVCNNNVIVTIMSDTVQLM